MKPLFLFLFAAASAFAVSPLTLGVKAGVPLTDFTDRIQSSNFGFNSGTKRYVAGPTVELKLPAGLAIEFDALYRRLNYVSVGTVNGVPVAITATGGALEFPLLAKFRFPTPGVKPFVDAGVAWDHISGLTQSVRSALNLTNSPTTSNTTKGFVMGAGLDIHAVVLHISPEVRYTRWGSGKFVDPVSMVQGNKSQAEFLLGITF